MKPWQKTNYVAPEEENANATVSVTTTVAPDVTPVAPTAPYVCPVCGRTFTKKVSLVNHLRAHKRRGEIDKIVV